MNLNEVCMGQQEIVQIAVNRNPIPEEKILSHCHQNSLQTYVKWIYIYICWLFRFSVDKWGQNEPFRQSSLIGGRHYNLCLSQSRGSENTKFKWGALGRDTIYFPFSLFLVRFSFAWGRSIIDLGTVGFINQEDKSPPPPPRCGVLLPICLHI